MAEGEISELHIGLKGTMNALFLKDLAAKTHCGSEINEATVRQLHRCEFMDGAQNIVLVGGPGTGKTPKSSELATPAAERLCARRFPPD